jgi:hypothetical protein
MAGNDLTYFSFPIEKHEETADGDLVIYGKATDGTIDGDLQVVDPDWSGKALQEWLDTGGNLRVQHNAQRDPAGKGLAVELSPDGHYVKALVVEPVAKELVKKGVLRDYSVGITHPKIDRDPSGKAMNGVITGHPDGRTKICELSLVDRGSNYNSRFQLMKSAGDGTPEYVGKMIAAAQEESVQLDLPPDISVTFSPADLAKLIAHRRTAEKRIAAKDWTQWDQQHEGSGGGKGKPSSAADAASAVAEAHETIEDEKDGDAKPTAAELHNAHLVHAAHEAHEAALAAKKPKKAKKAARAEKRDMDPDVGGGVDRDKIPDEDFAGPGRTFPIVKPQDVADTVPNLNHTDHDPDKIRDNIKRIAHRKGPEFEAKLPESWKAGEASVTKETETGDEQAAEKAKKKGKKGKPPFPGAAPPFRKKDEPAAGDADHDGEDGDDADKSDDPDVAKAGKRACSGCGKNYHADAPEKFCGNCGTKLPGAAKAGEPDAVKGEDPDGQDGEDPDGEPGGDEPEGKDKPGSGDSDSDGDEDGDEDDGTGKAAALARAAKKARKAARKLAELQAKLQAPGTAKGKPTPGDGVTGEHTGPVPAHREPDGPAIESLEHDAHLPTDPDGPYENKDMEKAASLRLKALGVPADMGALHDLLCPAYEPGDAAKAHPYASLADVVDTDAWMQKALEAAASAPLDQAGALNVLWQHAGTLKGADPEVVAEVSEALHKAFADANPGPGTAPTPGEITAQRFRRPYIAAGHAADSPQARGPNTASIPASGGITAGDYTRGYLGTGHAADSPANKGEDTPPKPGASNGGRVFYRNTARDNTKAAMQAMHDHIAQTFPDLCPMKDDPHADEPPSPNPLPVPARKTAKAVKAKANTGTPAEAPAVQEPPAEPVVKASGAAQPDLVKAAVAEAVTEALSQRDTEYADELRKLLKTIKKQNTMLDAIASQPDPAGPYRGAPLQADERKTTAPAGLSMAGAAERSRQMVYEQLHAEWRNSPDPTTRLAAEKAMAQMREIPTSL